MNNSKEKGIGTIEVLVSLMVIVSAVSAVILVVAGNQDIKLDNDVSNIALYRAGEIIGKTRTASEVNFNSVISSSSPNDIFNDGLKVTDISPCRKDIVASVSWSIRPGRLQNVSLTTSLVSEEEAAALGSDCELTPSSDDWEPLTCDENGFDFSPGGLEATGMDVISRGPSKFAIITSGTQTNKDDFWIVQVTGATWPTFTNSINFPGPYLNDVDASDDYAFAVNHDSSGQLQVIDISDFNNSTLIASRSLPGVSGSYPEGREIVYYDGRVYIGTWETSGNEFHVFDVSDPANPVHLGSKQINHSVRDIFVRRELIGGVTKVIAYLAVSVTSDVPELIILDVTDPTAMTETGTFNPPGIQYATAVYVLGDKLYLGRRKGTDDEFHVLDISDHSSITLLDSVSLDLNGVGIPEVRDVVVSGNFAFIATTDANEEFKVFNVSNPLDIRLVSACNYPAKAVEMDFDGTYIYMSNDSNDGLRRVFDN